MRDEGEQIELVAGETLRSPAEIGNLLLTTRDGRPVYVRDVADVAFATDTSDALVSTVTRDGDGVDARARRHAGHRQARRLECGHASPRPSCTASSSCKGTLIPDDIVGRGDPRLWRDGQ